MPTEPPPTLAATPNAKLDELRSLLVQMVKSLDELSAAIQADLSKHETRIMLLESRVDAHTQRLLKLETKGAA